MDYRLPQKMKIKITSSDRQSFQQIKEFETYDDMVDLYAGFTSKPIKIPVESPVEVKEDISKDVEEYDVMLQELSSLKAAKPN